tara:strand:- start:21 stop:344 length:324 start_codon:yes stop_codon:yes gene_type:complete
MINPTSKIDAVKVLYGKDSYNYCDGNGVVRWKDGHTTTDAEVKAIDDKYKELLAEYDANQYQRDRQYPALGEQLDMLFHDMTAGKGSKDGEWYKAVAKVKSDNPKPE